MYIYTVHCTQFLLTFLQGHLNNWYHWWPCPPPPPPPRHKENTGEEKMYKKMAAISCHHIGPLWANYTKDSFWRAFPSSWYTWFDTSQVGRAGLSIKLIHMVWYIYKFVGLAFPSSWYMYRLPFALAALAIKGAVVWDCFLLLRPCIGRWSRI
jgi:hypothetical protein